MSPSFFYYKCNTRNYPLNIYSIKFYVNSKINVRISFVLWVIIMSKSLWNQLYYTSNNRLHVFLPVNRIIHKKIKIYIKNINKREEQCFEIYFFFIIPTNCCKFVISESSILKVIFLKLLIYVCCNFQHWKSTPDLCSNMLKA